MQSLYYNIGVRQRNGPGGVATPRGHGPRKLLEETVIKDSVPKTERRMLTILREAEERYRHELMDDDERLEVLARIKRLRGRLAK